MVVTPWGDSDSLRGRQLQPVRGAPAEEVERNQRERLFAAMVACLNEKGFAATTVADLVEVSGVSSRSFYDLFGEKSRCLRETIEAILSQAGARLGPEDSSADLETLLRQLFQAFATGVAAQPAAAKVCLSEAFAAGEVALRAGRSGPRRVRAPDREALRGDTASDAGCRSR